MSTRAATADRTIEFFLDFMSPTAYLAHTQLPAIAERTRARVLYRPMLTLELHELTGNRSPMAVRAKARWAMQDLARFAALYQVPLVMNPHFPLKMLDALHGAMVALEEGNVALYCDVLFDAVWVDAVDVDDREELAKYLGAKGIEADAILSRVDEPEVQAALKANTAEAAERGAFGAPTIFVAEEMHFGQDRLAFVERALERVQ